MTTEFQAWQKSFPRSKTTLEQQVEFAQRLATKSLGTESDNAAAAPTAKQILQRIQNTPIGSMEHLVSWKGVRVGWFLEVFCEKNLFIQRLRKAGCPLWFFRKVCVVELIRRSHHHHHVNNNESQILSGPFVEHIQQFITAWNLQNNTNTPILVEHATLFVSYSGAYQLELVIQALHQLNPNEYIWLDIFCVDQFAWTGKGRSPEMALLRETFTEDLDQRIQKIGRTALILERWNTIMETLGQIWVLWEIFNTAKVEGAELMILLPPHQVECFVSNCLESSDEFNFIELSLRTIDVRRAKAEDALDSEVLLRQMHKHGLGAVNSLVISMMRKWFMDVGRKRLVNSIEEKGVGSYTRSLYFINNLGLLLKARRKLGIAEPYFCCESLAEARSNQLGNSDPSIHVSSIGNNGAPPKPEQGNLGEADSQHKTADSAGKWQPLDDPHPTTLTHSNNSSLFLLTQAHHIKTKPLGQEETSGQEFSGDSHVSTVPCIALPQQDRGKMEETEQPPGNTEDTVSLFDDATIECYQQQIIEIHSKTLFSINNLASLLHNQRKSNKAEALLQEALSGIRNQFGDLHPTTQSFMGNVRLVSEDRVEGDEEILHSDNNCSHQSN